MSKLNKMSINTLTGKGPIKLPKPDEKWVLPDAFIGLEIETEGTRVRNSNVLRSAGWDWHHDPSLRENGQEFTFKDPLMGDEVTRAINVFFDESRPVDYSTNPRAGVHIHINWLDERSDIRALRNLIAIMYCIEPGVFDWVDSSRKWCGYCCQLSELGDTAMRSLMTTESEQVMISLLKENGELSQNRYYGVNLAALGKYGTVEFRYFPSTKSKEDIENWVQFVMQVKRASDKFEGESNQLIDILSTQEGITGFLLTHFAEFDIGRTILDNLDVRAAVDRMTDFGYLVKLTPARKPAGFQRPRSIAALRFIGKKYPGMLPQFEAGALFVKPGMMSEDFDMFEAYLASRDPSQIPEEPEPRLRPRVGMNYNELLAGTSPELRRILEQAEQAALPVAAPQPPQWAVVSTDELPTPEYWGAPSHYAGREITTSDSAPTISVGYTNEGDNS